MILKTLCFFKKDFSVLIKLRSYKKNRKKVQHPVKEIFFLLYKGNSLGKEKLIHFHCYPLPDNIIKI